MHRSLKCVSASYAHFTEGTSFSASDTGDFEGGHDIILELEILWATGQNDKASSHAPPQQTQRDVSEF